MEIISETLVVSIHCRSIMRINLELHNEFIQQFLDKSNKAEAFSWLDEATDESFRSVGDIGYNEKSLDLIKEIYDAGAVEVIAVEIDSYQDGRQNTGELIVVLPDNVDARKRVFAWCRRQAESLGFDGDEDIGQKHLFVMLD